VQEAIKQAVAARIQTTHPNTQIGTPAVSKESSLEDLSVPLVGTKRLFLLQY
jgi:hypothetical protein